jgi:hypothetical protein
MRLDEGSSILIADSLPGQTISYPPFLTGVDFCEEWRG